MWDGCLITAKMVMSVLVRCGKIWDGMGWDIASRAVPWVDMGFDFKIPSHRGMGYSWDNLPKADPSERLYQKNSRTQVWCSEHSERCQRDLFRSVRPEVQLLPFLVIGAGKGPWRSNNGSLWRRHQLAEEEERVSTDMFQAHRCPAINCINTI